MSAVPQNPPPPELIWVHGQAVAVPAGQWPQGRSPRALLRLAGPVLPAWRKALAQAGLDVHFWCPPQGVCVQMPPRWRQAPAELAGLGFCVGGLDYQADQCQRFEHGGPALPPSGLPWTWYDLVCFDRSTALRLRPTLAAMGAQVLASGSSKLRVQFAGDAQLLRALVGVKLVDHVRGASLLSNAAVLRASVGAVAKAPAAWRLDGAGEVIAVADTGLDGGDGLRAMHPDFAGRVRALLALPTNPSWAAGAQARAPLGADRSSGHGTHVAGLACGSGAASAGQQGGIAPAAELVFLAIEQQLEPRPGAALALPTGFQLSGRPLDLRELYRAGAAQGATIHNLSWGDATRGAYSDDCFETDLFLREDPLAVVVCAVGNDGADANGDRRSDAGRCYSPACAKNCIAVGATEGPLQGLGARATWADLDPARVRWRHSADRNDPVSGEPRRIAPFSSAGPTLDGRIKPELCAPATNLPSTRSRASAAQGWGLADPIPLYMYDGGTSMAAPLVSGALALLRQAWRNSRRVPSGAALKALALLAGTPVQARDGSVASVDEAGFGLLDLARALPPKLAAVAGWQVTLRDAQAQRLDTGQQRDFAITLRQRSRLRALLCWVDPAGERLINDLDLALLAPDGRTLALGGDGRQPRNTEPDRRNPVECLDETELKPGRHTLSVSGHNVMDGPQRFALVWAIQALPP